MSAIEATSSASPRTYGPFIDFLTESRTLKDLYKALDIEAESDKTTDFKKSLFDFFRDGRTSFITRLRDSSTDDNSKAYEGLGLTLGSDATNSSLCAVYLNPDTSRFAVQLLHDPSYDVNGGMFSNMCKAAEEATDRVMKDLGLKDGAMLFEQGSVEDDHFHLALLALSDFHPQLGTGRAATPVKGDETEPGEARTRLRSTSSVLDVAQWLLESVLNLRKYQDILKTVWTSMVQHRLRPAFDVNSATAVLPSAAVFCSTAEPSQDVAGCLLIGASSKRDTAGTPRTYTRQWYALKEC